MNKLKLSDNRDKSVYGNMSSLSRRTSTNPYSPSQSYFDDEEQFSDFGDSKLTGGKISSSRSQISKLDSFKGDIDNDIKKKLPQDKNNSKQQKKTASVEKTTKKSEGKKGTTTRSGKTINKNGPAGKEVLKEKKQKMLVKRKPPAKNQKINPPKRKDLKVSFNKERQEEPKKNQKGEEKPKDKFQKPAALELKKGVSDMSNDELSLKNSESERIDEQQFHKIARKVLKKIAKELMKVNNLERKVAQSIALNLENRIRNHLEKDSKNKDLSWRIKTYKVSVVDLVKKIQVSYHIHPRFLIIFRTKSSTLPGS